MIIPISMSKVVCNLGRCIRPAGYLSSCIVSLILLLSSCNYSGIGDGLIIPLVMTSMNTLIIKLSNFRKTSNNDLKIIQIAVLRYIIKISNNKKQIRVIIKNNKVVNSKITNKL
jgi:hypothetical protein